MAPYFSLATNKFNLIYLDARKQLKNTYLEKTKGAKCRVGGIKLDKKDNQQYTANDGINYSINKARTELHFWTSINKNDKFIKLA